MINMVLDGIKEGMTDETMDIFDLFFPSQFRRNDRSRRPRTEDLIHELKVKLEDLYNGKEIKLKITRNIVCSICKGSGCKEGKNSTTCSECHGQGHKIQRIQMGMMMTQQLVTCPSCRGEGRSVAIEDRCESCNGKMTVPEEKIFEVHIEPGMEDNDHITFQGASDEVPGADAGDVIVVIREEKNDVFIRKHDDLLVRKEITLTQALLGTSFSITHLDGRILIAETPKGKVVTPNSVKVIEREGMPIRGNSYSRGKLYVKFDIIFPDLSKMTSEFRNSLVRTFPPPDELKGVNLEDENTYQCSLAESDFSQFENSQRSGGQERNEAYSNQEDLDEERNDCQTM